LGLRAQDAIVGFLYLGTVAVPAPSLPRSAPAERNKTGQARAGCSGDDSPRTFSE
jgi:hypothetical protein